MTAEACLLLAVLTPVVVQEAPQKVERMTEIRWCQEAHRLVLREYRYIRIGGYEQRRIEEDFSDLHEFELRVPPVEQNGP